MTAAPLSNHGPGPGAANRAPAGLRILLLLVILAIVGVDQWTKQLAREHLILGSRHYAGGLLTLLLTENEGAFLSLGATLPPTTRTVIFGVAVTIAVVIALFILLTGRVRGVDAVAVALIAAGGVGNLIDRLTRGGRVTDFIYLSAGPLHTGIFNVADMAITGAVLWLLVSSFVAKK